MEATYLLAFSTLLLTFSHLPGKALGCSFGTQQITLDVLDSTAVNALLGTLAKTNDSMTCPLESCGFDIRQYIRFVDKGESVDFELSRSFGDLFDKGDIPASSSFICSLQCGEFPYVIVNVEIIDSNNRAPVFSVTGGQSITISQSMPTGIDFGSLINGGQLRVFDADFDTSTNGAIDLSVDNSKFAVLPPAVATATNIGNKANAKIYFPRIALAEPLTGDATFNLIAKDRGNPQQSSSIPISVIMEPFQDLEFEQDFYTATVSDPTFTGIVSVDQGRIRVKNTGSVSYSITNDGGADLELIVANDGVDVNLMAPIDATTLNKNTLIVVIQADLEIRSRRVVLVIGVPPAATTTETSTSTSTQTTQEITCPTVTCPDVTCPDVTCPVVTCPSGTCPPCETTVATTCPPVENTTPCDCPSTCPTSPTTETTTCPLTCPPPTTCDCSSVTPTVSSASPDSSTSYPPTCPLTCPTSEAPTECPLTCPAVTECPTGEPTECPVTCPPTTECPITCPTSAPSTECPMTCPTSVQPTQCPTVSPTTCPPCSTVTQPSGSTPSPGDPVVKFERQVYVAQTVASEVGDILQVKASVTNSQSAITYSVIDEKSLFDINATSGVIRSTRPLQQSLVYEFEAVARVDSGQQDRTQVRVQAVPRNVSCDEEFIDSLYEFQIDERKNGTLGSVNFTSSSYDLSVGWTLPDGFRDSFSVKSDGQISITKAIEYRAASRIWVSIQATGNAAFRHSPFSTIVDVKINDVNEPPRFKYSKEIIIGYPKRTLIDPSVPMPLFTFQAVDDDVGDNAILTYSLRSSSAAFSIDPESGTVHLEDSIADSCAATCNISVTATDKGTPPLSATQQATILPLSPNEIHVLKCEGPDTQSNADIAGDLTRILGYQVAVLLRKNPSTTTRANIEFDVTVYAVSGSQFVSRDAFQAKIKEKTTELNKLPWKLTTESVADAPPYQVDDLVQSIDDLSQSKSDLTIATAVLGSLIGIAILSAVAFIAVKKVKGGGLPSVSVWSSGKEEKSDRRDSLTRTREFLARKSTSKSDDDSNGTLSSMYSTENGLPRTSIKISDQKVFIDEELMKRPPPTAVRKNADDDIVYNPESPKPKKSIMKEPKEWDVDDKDKRKSGVKFDPTPEVIQVPSTTPVVTEDDSDESSAASDPEIEVEIL